MDEVKVNKDTLLATLKTNRDDHVTKYNAAMKIYREDAIVELGKMLKSAKTTDAKIIRYMDLPEPECHENDYNTIIAMLEMSVDKEIVLSSQEFRTYVLNEWGWQRAFTSNSLSYLNKAAK